MKAVFGIAIVIFGGMLIYWFTMATPKEKPGIDIPIAFGKPGGGQIEMHAVVGVVLANKSRRNEGVAPGKPVDWNEWVQTHCLLKDATGQAVPVQRQGKSAIIRPLDVQATVGTEEFFITAPVKPGTTYTFDYIIEQPQPTTYRYQFTAPGQAERIVQHRFELQ